MPSYSSDDRHRLTGLISSEIIFPLISGETERAALQNRLLEFPGRLLSINTLIQDTIYPEQPAKAFRNLLPRRFKGTLREAMLGCWRSQDTGGAYGIQTSEHDFRPVLATANLFSVSMIQLWLFALRLRLTSYRCKVSTADGDMV